MYTVNLTLDHGIFMPITVMAAFNISAEDLATPGMLDAMIETYRIKKAPSAKVTQVTTSKLN